MNNFDLTIQNFFLFSSDQVRNQDTKSLETTPSFVTIKNALKQKAASIGWPGLMNAVISRLPDLLGVSIKPILSRAWAKHIELQRYLEGGEESSDETVILALAEHEITSNHQPSVQILLDEHLLAEICLDIHLTMLLKGFNLLIQNGRIRECRTGSCVCGGSLSCEGITLLEKKTQEFPLPGIISFERGIEST